MAKLSQDTINLVLNLYNQKTFTKKEIAAQAGCSIDSVNRILERNGLKEIKLSKKLQAIVEEVTLDFLKGAYCKDLAKKYNVDEHSIYKILDIKGIKRQSGYHSNCVENYFEQIDNPHKAYLLGFITADGAIVNNILSIEIHKKDKELLNFAKEQINPKATLTSHGDCLKVTFSAKKISKDLAKYGIIQNKSKILKAVPIQFIPSNLLPFYFRGLIDGDGCVGKEGKISIYSGSEDFIKNVQSILVEKVKVSKLSIYHGTTYFVSWGGKEDKIKFFHYIYDDLDATFYYKRKYERLKNALN